LRAKAEGIDMTLGASHLRRGFLGMVLLALMHGPAVPATQNDTIVFDLNLKGFRAGRLAVNGIMVDTQYAANGILQSTGILGALRKIKYEASVQGSVSFRSGLPRYTPTRYTEESDNGRRTSESSMDYVNGVPQVKVYNPPRAPRSDDVDPATQGGSIDPLTALYATLRDMPAEEACTLSVVLFDGRYRTQVVLSDRLDVGESILCAGEYRRLEGFSEAEMAEKQSFPFHLTYLPTPEGKMRVTLITLDTLFGKGTLRRR